MARKILKDVQITPEEQLEEFGKIITQEKFKNMQKDQIINNLGQELTKIKLQQLKK